jgi:WASH complex subunit 7
MTQWSDLVEGYLNAMFYGMSYITPHDWHTYMEMRELAREKYALDLLEIALPTGAADQV